MSGRYPGSVSDKGHEFHPVHKTCVHCGWHIAGQLAMPTTCPGKADTQKLDAEVPQIKWREWL